MIKKRFFTHILLLALLTLPLQAKQLKNKEGIACMIIDFKFDGKTIKFLEFGRLEMSRLEGHEQLYGTGKIWKKLWKHLCKFNLPIWYVGEKFTNDKAIRQFDYLEKIGGSYHRDFSTVEKDPIFAKATMGKPLSKRKKRQYIKNYKGIIIDKFHKGSKLKKLKKEYPDFIVINCRSVDYCANKHKASQLFEMTKLDKYKPNWKAYPAKYSPTLANEIVQDLSCDTVVIKPLSSSKGKGVIIVDKQNLDKTLKKIFTNKSALQKEEDVAFNYWADYTRDTFLVECFEQSKPVCVKKEEYDGTARVVVVLTHDKGKITLRTLGFYWKLPVKALSEEGTLLEKHKSKIKKGKPSSAKVSKKDQRKIRKILKKIMPKLYKKMIELN